MISRVIDLEGAIKALNELGDSANMEPFRTMTDAVSDFLDLLPSIIYEAESAKEAIGKLEDQVEDLEEGFEELEAQIKELENMNSELAKEITELQEG